MSPIVFQQLSRPLSTPTHDRTAGPIAELEGLLRCVSPSDRTVLLKGVTDPFLQKAAPHRAEHVALFDTIFELLAVDAEQPALASVSKSLASRSDVPVRLAQRLAANENLAVAEPMLLQASCLDDAFLVDMAKVRSQEHLLAIACRAHIGAPVAEAIIERGDDVVVRYVANNPGACFAESSLQALGERSKSDAALAEQIKQRDDLRRVASKGRR